MSMNTVDEHQEIRKVQCIQYLQDNSAKFNTSLIENNRAHGNKCIWLKWTCLDTILIFSRVQTGHVF